MKGILFVCTGNACRSQVAEGFARRVFPPEVAVFSAGMIPTGVDPRAIAVMAELGIDVSNQRSKPLAEIPLDKVDHVVTLCGDTAERCPIVPSVRREHWPFPDPVRAQGTEAEVLDAFRRTRDEILSRVVALADAMSKEIAS